RRTSPWSRGCTSRGRSIYRTASARSRLLLQRATQLGANSADTRRHAGEFSDDRLPDFCRRGSYQSRTVVISKRLKIQHSTRSGISKETHSSKQICGYEKSKHHFHKNALCCCLGCTFHGCASSRSAPGWGLPRREHGRRSLSTCEP